MTDQENSIVDTNALIAQRRTKLTELRRQKNAYPNHFHRDALAAALRKQYSEKTETELDIFSEELF